MKSIFSTIKTYFFLTVGASIYVLAWVIFLIPNEIVGGGVSGIGSLIYFATGKGFPISYSFFIINGILLLIAMKDLGGSFGIRTVYSIIISSIGFEIFPPLVNSFAPELITNLASNGSITLAIFGGVISGAGIGINFLQGGSTGGTDIVALILNKRLNLSPGRALAYVDLVIISSSFFIFHDITKVIYGYVLLGVVSFTVDWVLSGSKQSVQIFIFSKKYNEIADSISKDLGRGVSVLTAVGWFTKEENKVLMVLARKYETNDIYRIIKSIDKDAFISVGSVMGVFGRGFDTIRLKKKEKA